MTGQPPLLEIRELKKYFPGEPGLARHGSPVRAVDGVSLSIAAGETLGLVGESGCGKSTLARTILRLQEPTSGDVLYRGRSIYQLGRRELMTLRREMQLVFQDAAGSLHPRHTVASILREGAVIHGLEQEGEEGVVELLRLVGLSPDLLRRFPHQLSGGQRQRVSIARALAVQPRLLICDEPVSGLDLSIQAQVLNLLLDLRLERGLSYLLISHDLGVIRHLSHRTAVMYLGELVEWGKTEELFDNPRHPYTQALLSAVPAVDRSERQARIVLSGDVPSATTPPSGCRFHPRCPVATSECARRPPPLHQTASDHSYRCLLEP